MSPRSEDDEPGYLRPMIVNANPAIRRRTRAGRPPRADVAFEPSIKLGRIGPSQCHTDGPCAYTRCYDVRRRVSDARSQRRLRCAAACRDAGAAAAQRPSGPRSALIARYVPIVRWLPAYDRANLRVDAIAGVVGWGVMVPVAMAYAGLAGVPPELGLVTAFAALAAYAVFGTSRHLKVTASSSIAIMSASVVGAIAASQDPAITSSLSAGAGARRRRHPRHRRRDAPRLPLAVPGCVGRDRVRHRPGVRHHRRPDPGPARHPARSSGTIIEQAGRDGRRTRRGRPVHGHPRRRHAPRASSCSGASCRASRRRSSRWSSASSLSTALDLPAQGVAVVGDVATGIPLPSIPRIPIGDIIFLVTGAFGIVFLALAESIGAARCVRRPARLRASTPTRS